MKKQPFLMLAAMLFSIFTLTVFFQITHAGSPDVDTEADISLDDSNEAEVFAKIECDIIGHLEEGESYSGWGHVSIWLDTWNPRDSDELWARVVRKRFLFWTWLSVDARDPLEVEGTRDMDSGDVISASASGYLGSASSNAYDFIIVD